MVACGSTCSDWTANTTMTLCGPNASSWEYRRRSTWVHAASGFAGRRVPLALTVASAAAIAMTGLFVHLDPRKMASGVYRLGQLVRASEEVFFHRSRLGPRIEFEELREGEEVEFQTRPGEKGPQAFNVKPR